MSLVTRSANHRTVQSGFIACMLLSVAGCPITDDPAASVSVVPVAMNVPDGDVEIAATNVAGHLFVDVFVNDAGPYKFILDTGAGASAVSPRIAALFPDGQLDATTTVNSNAGAITAPLFRVDSLSMGAVQFESFQAIVQDLDPTFPKSLFPIDGIIGIPLFAGVALTLDYPRGTVRVQAGQLPEADGCTVLPIEGGRFDERGTFELPTMLINIHGQDVRALVDSGNNAFATLPPSFADLPFVGATTPVSFNTITGSADALLGKLNGSVSFGCAAFSQPLVVVGGNLAILGSDAMDEFVVTLDQPNQRIRFIHR